MDTHNDDSRTPSGIKISPGRPRKLPKMSDRDRAKYYRDKNREYDRSLIESVTDLQEEARLLGWRSQVLKALSNHGVSFEVSNRILNQLHPLMTQPDTLNLYGFKSTGVEYQGAWMLGDAEAPVVALGLQARGQYTKNTAEQVYQHIPGRKDILEYLLYNQVEYSCIVRFFFSANGECVDQELEVDWVSGLLRCFGNLEHVELVAEFLRGPVVLDPPSRPGTSPMKLEHILSDP